MNLLSQFVELYDNEEEYQRRIANYQRVLKTEEWDFVRDTLLTIRGKIANDMFSRKFTELDPDEKDTVQRAYFQIDQVIEFLLNPVSWIQKRSRWSQITSKMKGDS